MRPEVHHALTPGATVDASAASSSADGGVLTRFKTLLLDHPILGPLRPLNVSDLQSVDVGTSTYSADENTAAEDNAMISSVLTSIGTCVFCLGVYIWSRHSKRMMRHVFAPVAWAAGTERGAAAFPGWLGWMDELRDDARTVITGGVGLEQRMIMRYIRHNLVLLTYGVVIIVPLTIFYAAYPWSHTNDLSNINPNCTTSDDDTANPSVIPEGCVAWWSVLGMLTIAHVPEESWRLYMPGVAACLFALVYVYEQTLEWRHYVAARHEWLCEEGVQHQTILLYAEGSQQVHELLSSIAPSTLGPLRHAPTCPGHHPPPALATIPPALATIPTCPRAHARPPPCQVNSADMYHELTRLVGDGEVVSVAPLNELRSGQSDAGLLEQAIYEATKPLSAKATKLSAATGADAAGAAIRSRVKETSRRATKAVKAETCMEAVSTAVRLAFFGEDEPEVTRFLVLLRTRRAAQICVALTRWPGELMAAPGFIRCESAPAPDDAFWPNLLKARWRLRLNWFVGLVLTTALFLFWTVPVAGVQALTSLDSLSQLELFAFLQPIIASMSSATKATLEGSLSSIVLQVRDLPKSPPHLPNTSTFHDLRSPCLPPPSRPSSSSSSST